MARELGGPQISALLESVPGIVNVLRSPVADALVGMIRAGADIEPFRLDGAKELVQYAVRRGLINNAEGEGLLAEVSTALAEQARNKRAAARGKSAAKKRPAARAKSKQAPKKVKSGTSAKKAAATRLKRR